MRGTGSLYLALREYSRYQNLTCLLFQNFKIEESKQFAVHSKKVKSKIDVNLPVASGDKVGSIFRKADRLHLRRDLVARNLTIRETIRKKVKVKIVWDQRPSFGTFWKLGRVRCCSEVQCVSCQGLLAKVGHSAAAQNQVAQNWVIVIQKCVALGTLP